MSSPQQTGSSDEVADLATVYGFILTDEGPIVYRDLSLWRQALDDERKQPFFSRPFGRRRHAQDRLHRPPQSAR